MKESVLLARRFREVILDGTWIANTNFKDQLEHMDWQLAHRKVQDLNTIAVLAQHIHYYIKGISQVLRGGGLEISDRYSFDFPPMTSAEQWKAFLATLWEDAHSFAGLVAGMPDSKLRETFVKVQYGTYARNIEGMIEHCYYHLGQVILIRKLLNRDQ
ncbi:MAG: DUF1572 domain-containing protein [Sphingobacteriales bacterium]|nr:MAG: DUF1572 domain-containing protein [Sphingobacteriales bacterium]